MVSSMNRKPAASLRPGSECSRGAAIGGVNGIILAMIGGAAPPVVLLAAVGAGAVGALIALLVWSASGVHEDPVLPPRNDC